VVRLVGAVLAETHDEWADTRRYMTVDALLRPNPVNEPKELLIEQAA
jgi:putative transposase